MRVLCVLALACLLSGCFHSAKPLFTEAEGACPFTEQTVFTVGQIDAGGAIVKRHAFMIAPDGPICVRTPYIGDEPPTRELFVPLENGWFIVQSLSNQTDEQNEVPLDAAQSSAAYSLARLVGRRLFFYRPACDDFTNAAIAEVGVTRDKAEPGNSTSCTLTSGAQVRTLFRAWIRLGAPPAQFGDAGDLAAR
jgi:hypothetical protein